MRSERLVTLKGPAGVGKSTVLMEAAREVAGDEPDGLWIINVAESPGIDQLVSSICAVLDRPTDLDVDDSVPLIDLLIEHIKPMSVWLLLDNAEHLVEPVYMLCDRLLRDTSGVRVVLGSRRTLGHPLERLIDLAPLQVPPEDLATADPSELRSAYPAIDVFASRAGAVSADFVLDEANVRQVATICRSLDGLPLALELAASLVRSLAVADIVDQLDDRFALLRASSVRDRHGSLESAIESSFGLVDPADQTLLRKLGQVIGPFSLADAACIADVAESDVALQLTRLGDSSLVNSDITALPTTRFHILQSLGEYARTRAASPGEAASDSVRHARCFARVARHSRSLLSGGPLQLNALNRIEESLLDFTKAVDTLLAVGDVALAQELVADISSYFVLRRRHRIGFAEITRVLRADPSLGGAAPATLHVFLARLYITDAQPPSEAAAAFTAAISHLESAGELHCGPVTEAITDVWRGYADWYLGDPAHAEDRWRSAADVLYKHEVMTSELTARAALAAMFSYTNRHDAAAEAVSRAIEITESTHDELGRAYALQVAGGVARAAGDHTAARMAYREGFRLARRFGLTMWATTCAAGEALSAWFEGDKALAVDRASAAEQHARTQPAREGLFSFKNLFLAPDIGIGHSELSESARSVIHLPREERGEAALRLAVDLYERYLTYRG